MNAGRVAARPFHFRDCDRFGRDVPDGCAAQLSAAQQWEFGQIARGDYLLELERGRTEFLGSPFNVESWRRVPKASTAAAVDAAPVECRHFVPASEYCPDCAPPPADVELEAFELEDHAPPVDVVWADDVPVPLW
jgi:hypothetical protein